MSSNLPSKTDLMLVLKEIQRSPSAKLERLREEEQKARDALESFEKKSVTHQRLTRAVEAANNKRYAEESRDRTTHSVALRKCRNAIRLDGVTPKTVTMVKELAKTHSDGK